MAPPTDDDVVKTLCDRWRSAGLAEGEVLLLHSRLSPTLRRLVALGARPSPDLVIRSFLDVLGRQGTLLLPLFNFDFTKGFPFHIRSTPSQMGVLTECGRTWPGVIRTGHPIYSFAVIGNKVDLFRGIKNFSGYGADSPFGMLRQIGGKIGILDLPDQNSMTFYHHVEESCNVSYRFHKTFTGLYTGEDDIERQENFGLFVRDVEAGVVTHVNPMGERLWSLGLYQGDRPNEGCGLRTISATALFEAVAEVIHAGKANGLLYKIQ